MTFELSAKDTTEIIPVLFDFTAVVGTDTINTASVSVSVVTGVDATPSTILSGVALISGKLVTQWITLGLSGVLYHLRCTIVTSGGQTIVLPANIPVITA